MRYWLFKSEPFKWSWEMQVAKGAEGRGMGRRAQLPGAQQHARDAIGDRGFFYHSNIGKEIVGIAEVCALAHPDSTTDDPRWECVDIRAVEPLPRPVTLAEIKDTPNSPRWRW
jgi:predicted RNA-binding protein with PUA-like domain